MEGSLEIAGFYLISTERGDYVNELFYCYSTTLMHFLKANGLRYKYTTIHKRTGNRMWVFDRTEGLKALLDEYDERKAAHKANAHS